MGSFEFVVLATLRTGQLTRGCLPRVTGDHTKAQEFWRAVLTFNGHSLQNAFARPEAQQRVRP